MSDQLHDLLNELLYSPTAEGAAFRDRCVRNLEAGLLARQYETAEEREAVLAEFYSLAARLRELDAPLFD